jgi:uncharacterized protein YbcI
MAETQERGTSVLMDVSRAMVVLHKEQFGRGPTSARTNWAGSDALVCVLEDVLLSAELKMVELGDDQRVRESRVAFQVATADDFIGAVEAITHRKVRAFGSATDVKMNVVFENFQFEPRPSGGDGTGEARGERDNEPGQDGQVGL